MSAAAPDLAQHAAAAHAQTPTEQKTPVSHSVTFRDLPGETGTIDNVTPPTRHLPLQSHMQANATSLSALRAEIEASNDTFNTCKRRRGVDQNVHVPVCDTATHPELGRNMSLSITDWLSRSETERARNDMVAIVESFHTVAGDLIPDDGNWDKSHPCAFAAMNNTDVLTQSEIKRAPDRNKFKDAQKPEIDGLLERDVFEFVDMETVPKSHRLLNATWSYRRKRRPNGELLKYKARICADGSMQQHGVDFFNTFAPVVAWSTVRLVLLLASVLKLHGRSINCVQAFTQAPSEEDVCMRVPEGWVITDEDGNVLKKKCNKLKKNLQCD